MTDCPLRGKKVCPALRLQGGRQRTGVLLARAAEEQRGRTIQSDPARGMARPGGAGRLSEAAASGGDVASARVGVRAEPCAPGRKGRPPADDHEAGTTGRGRGRAGEEEAGPPAQASALNPTPKPHACPGVSASAPGFRLLAESLRTNVPMPPQARFIISHLELLRQSPNLLSGANLSVLVTRKQGPPSLSQEQRLTTTRAYGS